MSDLTLLIYSQNDDGTGQLESTMDFKSVTDMREYVSTKRFHGTLSRVLSDTWAIDE